MLFDVKSWHFWILVGLHNKNNACMMKENSRKYHRKKTDKILWFLRICICNDIFHNYNEQGGMNAEHEKNVGNVTMAENNDEKLDNKTDQSDVDIKKERNTKSRWKKLFTGAGFLLCGVLWIFNAVMRIVNFFLKLSIVIFLTLLFIINLIILLFSISFSFNI